MENKMVFSKNDTAAVKGIAILIMMLHHCFMSADRYEGYDIVFWPFSESVTVYVAAFGKICVGMFVFLSTYGMTISLKRLYPKFECTGKQLSEYVMKRYYRLMSGWIFIFTVSQLFGFFYAGRQREIYGSGIKAIMYFLIDMSGLAHLLDTPIFLGTWWYMSLAILIIFSFPIFIHMYRKIGAAPLIMLAFLLPKAIEISRTDFINWLMAMVLGVVFAEADVLVKLKSYGFFQRKYIDKVLKLCIYIILILFSIKFRQTNGWGILYDIRDGVIPVLIICFTYEFITDIKGIQPVLGYLGKHSMNIFLIHTFIRTTYFKDVTYGMRYVPLIIIFLLVSSLLVSVVIEILKSKSGYGRLVVQIERKIFND